MMPERTLIAQLEWTHVWLAAITALWGGLVSYFRRVQAGLEHSWLSVCMHMSMSGFAGLLCWLGCLQFDVPAPLTAICTGLAGHMGAEFIKIIETKFASKLTQDICMPHFGRRATDIDPHAAPAGQNHGRRAEDRK
jgi:hypothetical protein